VHLTHSTINKSEQKAQRQKPLILIVDDELNRPVFARDSIT